MKRTLGTLGALGILTLALAGQTAPHSSVAVHSIYGKCLSVTGRWVACDEAIADAKKLQAEIKQLHQALAAPSRGDCVLNDGKTIQREMRSACQSVQVAGASEQRTECGAVLQMLDALCSYDERLGTHEARQFLDEEVDRSERILAAMQADH